MKRTLMRLLAVAAILVPVGVLLGAAPAYAGGQIFAVLYLTNNTQLPISIPFSGAYTPDAWGTQGNPMDHISPGWIVMPDGTPPRMLMPGQTMLWGTKSNGGLFATSGTGGSLSIPLPEDQTGHINWSVPWSFFNGGFPPQGAYGNANVSTSGGFKPPYPYTVPANGTTFSGCSGNGPNTCIFGFVINGGQGVPAPTPGALVADQSISEPSTCPSNTTCHPAIHSLTSPDGSTTLDINYGCNLGPHQQQSGGVLELGNRFTQARWREPACNIIGAQMQSDGNFVAWDAAGDIVWQTNTFVPGAYLSVSTSKVSVLVNSYVCSPVFEHGTVHCDFRIVVATLWSASARTAPMTG